MFKKKLTTGILLEKTIEGVSQKGLIKRLTNYINSYNLDVFLGPEWLFIPKDRLYASSEKEEIIGRIAESTKDNDTLIIPGSIMWEDNCFFYNTTPVISKGQLIGENHKFLDGGDARNAKNRNCNKRFYNEKSNHFFKWKDYRVGVEICADRGTIQDILHDSNEPLLDMYFLVSCGITLYEGENMHIKNEGYALYSNGSQPDCAAF